MATLALKRYADGHIFQPLVLNGAGAIRPEIMEKIKSLAFQVVVVAKDPKGGQIVQEVKDHDPDSLRKAVEDMSKAEKAKPASPAPAGVVVDKAPEAKPADGGKK